MDLNPATIETFRKECLTYKSEEEVRIGLSEFLRKLSETMGFTIQTIGHEYGFVHGGSADSVYKNVIVEFKLPDKFKTQNGIDEAVFGRPNSTDRGLFHYIVNSSLDENPSYSNEDFWESMKSKVGVGFDGVRFVFCRYVDDSNEIAIYNPSKTQKFPHQLSPKAPLKFETETVNDFELGVKKLVLFLRSTTRSRLSSISLLSKFGPQSALCKKAIKLIYQSLETNLASNPRVSTLFDEWNRIFGDIYGDKETDFTTIKKPICEEYDLPLDIDIRKILFVIQTYYNLILKLLISDLFESLKDPSLKHRTDLTRNELNLLFSGKLQNDYKVDNFFEVNYFEWFIFASDFDYSIISDILIEVQTFETTASVIRPEIVEDAFREMYEGLMPSELRHLMGEYYTPGWLVEFVLNKAGYFGQKDKTVLDPCCGSGSFLTHAMKRLRANSGLSQNDFIQTATLNIVGYDINPITVISAKTNYLLSLGDISGYKNPISIPVYMCDSILVPTVHAKQIRESNSIKVKTVVGEFELPVFRSRIDSDIFLKEVSKCVENYTFEQFIDYMKKNTAVSFDGVNMAVAEAFYNKVCDLHLSSRDGYWGIILKNSFAPLFVKDGCDFVVGNPPWIAWKAMSDTYRTQTLDIWLSYGIFDKSAYDKITTHDDFAMAVTYVSVDHYCKADGKVAFVLPQTFVKTSKGGEGFRKFRITSEGKDIPFSVSAVYDMDAIKPFRGFATNRASVMIFEKGHQMSYPMDSYFQCVPENGQKISARDSFQEASAKFCMNQLIASPIKKGDERSPWLTLTKEDMDNASKYLGKSAYRGRKGIEPAGAKGIYIVDVGEGKEGFVSIKNRIERSRLEEAKTLGSHAGLAEKEFVYPMVGGRNISKWGISSNFFMVVPHHSSGDSIYAGVPEAELKVSSPKLFAWLMYFHDLLLKTRIQDGKFYNAKTQPFYRLDNVGEYTFAPFKVVWREQNSDMVSCVLSTIDNEWLGSKIPVVDSKVLFCPLYDEDEAHYLCAIINAPFVAHIIDSYTISTNRGIDILQNIKIPKFDKTNPLHLKLSALSKKAHVNFKKGTSNESVEKEINEEVKKLFG